MAESDSYRNMTATASLKRESDFMVTCFSSFLMILSVILLAGCTVVADDCEETITIDSVVYPVGESWCGRLIDSAEIAEPASLVQLPDELTFEDSRIYVLPETKEAFVAMAEAAKEDSILLIADSGWRSFSFQRRIIRRRLERGDKIEEILQSVAPPGYSEHHTGRALDLCPSEARFAHTDIYKWLKENAGRFGFIESLPKSDSNLILWESWHIYYIGMN